MQLARSESRDIFSLPDKKDSVVAALARLPAGLLKTEVVEQLNDRSTIERQQAALILRSVDFLAADAALTGGKGSSLAILSCIRDVVVPAFFSCTIHAFNRHFAAEARCAAGLTKLEDASHKLKKDGESFDNLSAVSKAAEELRDLISNTPLVPEVSSEVAAAYAELCKSLGSTADDVPVAVRSSATTEDSANASTAGQHDSFLNVIGTNDVLQAVRACWASCFTERACIYRVRCGVSQRAAIMSVVVQQMVQPLVVAGTAFSLNIGDSYAGPHISATYGLGESVVSGSVHADSWQYDNKLTLIRRDLGTKLTEIVPLPPDPANKHKKTGTVEQEVDAPRRERYCMSDAQAALVAKAVVAIQGVYKACFGYDHVDTEFAVDAAGNVRLLQSRPVVQLEKRSIRTVDRHAVGPHNKIVQASYSLPGAHVGTAKVVYDFEKDVATGNVTLEAGDILITYKTSNYVEKFIADVSAIITMQGSPSAHPILIGRERGLPVLCGIPDLMERAAPLHGKTVTIDGLTKWLYTGAVPLKEADAKQLAVQFDPQAIVPVENDAGVLKFLTDYGRRVQEEVTEGATKKMVDWVRNPNSTLPVAWLELYGNSYAARFAFVNAVRKNKLAKDPLCNEHKAFGAYNTDLLVPVAQTMSIFEGMDTVAEFDAYHDAVDAAAKRYLRACEEFAEKGPSTKLWQEYEEAYAPMFMALWLSYFWRMHLKRASSTLANSLGITQYHYGEMLKYEQEVQTNAHSEEANLHWQITDVAEDLRRHVLSTEEEKELASTGQIVKISHATVIAVATRGDKRVEKIATSYRIGKKSDISDEPPLALVLDLIVQALENGRTNPKSKPHQPRSDFFPATPDVSRVMAAHIRGRMQNTDMHHLKLRGGWWIRRGLERLARGSGLELQDIFQMNLNGLRALIAQYEKSPHGPASPLSPLLMSPFADKKAFEEAVEAEARKKHAASSSGGVGIVGAVAAFAAGLVAGIIVQKKLLKN